MIEIVAGAVGVVLTGLLTALGYYSRLSRQEIVGRIVELKDDLHDDFRNMHERVTRLEERVNLHIDVTHSTERNGK